MPEPVYVIWSFEHEGWWGPGWRGYTRNLAKAGRYTGEQAAAIVAQANIMKEEERLQTLETAETLGPPILQRLV
jgi:hypothetical protein